MDLQNLKQFQWGACGFIVAIQAAILNGKNNILKTSVANATAGKATDAHAILYPIIEDFCDNHKDFSPYQ